MYWAVSYEKKKKNVSYKWKHAWAKRNSQISILANDRELRPQPVVVVVVVVVGNGGGSVVGVAH